MEKLIALLEIARTLDRRDLGILLKFAEFLVEVSKEFAEEKGENAD